MNSRTIFGPNSRLAVVVMAIATWALVAQPAMCRSDIHRGSLEFKRGQTRTFTGQSIRKIYLFSAQHSQGTVDVEVVVHACNDLPRQVIHRRQVSPGGSTLISSFPGDQRPLDVIVHADGYADVWVHIETW